MVHIRSADTLIGPTVAATIAELDLAGEDAVAVRLAERYAAAIDDADDPIAALERLGPKLLGVLDSLGATPKGRAAIRKATTNNGGPNRLQQLRQAR